MTSFAGCPSCWSWRRIKDNEKKAAELNPDSQCPIPVPKQSAGDVSPLFDIDQDRRRPLPDADCAVRQTRLESDGARRRYSSPASISTPSASISQAVSAGQIRNLLINIPPRHMKSLAVCVFWPAWEWIMHSAAAVALCLVCPVALGARFGEMPAVDRIALVPAALGRPLPTVRRPEHQAAVSTTTTPAIASPPASAAPRPAKGAIASSSMIRTMSSTAKAKPNASKRSPGGTKP